MTKYEKTKKRWELAQVEYNKAWEEFRRAVMEKKKRVKNEIQ